MSVFLQGFPRENSKHLYSIKENIKWFHLITALFVIQGLVMNSVMAILIMRHVVDAFMHLILLRKALGLIFGILIFVGYLFSSNKVTAYMQTHDIAWPIKDSNHPNEGLEGGH
jgi:energy-coupling factor transporter transmembrane protein EcfT